MEKYTEIETPKLPKLQKRFPCDGRNVLRPSKVPRWIASNTGSKNMKGKLNFNQSSKRQMTEAATIDKFPQMVTEIQNIFTEVQQKVNMLANEVSLSKLPADVCQAMIQQHISNAADNMNMQLYRTMQSRLLSNQKDSKTHRQYSVEDEPIPMIEDTHTHALAVVEDKICQTELSYEKCQCSMMIQRKDQSCQTELPFQTCFQDTHSPGDGINASSINFQNFHPNSESSPDTATSGKEDLKYYSGNDFESTLSGSFTTSKRSSNFPRFMPPFSNENPCFENVKYSSKFYTILNQLESYHHLTSVCAEQFLEVWEDMEQQSLNMKKSKKSDAELVSRYKQEMALRKKYHNELMNIKGNIRIFCRIRPSNPDIEEPSENCVCTNPDFKDVVLVKHKKRIINFELNLVFPQDSTQSEVFEEVKSLITSCVDGFNVCIVAYGQTGSGKTYTMEGTLTDPGINPRALDELFKEISAKDDWIYSVYVSVVEIYNEQIRDLLSTEKSKLEVWNIEGDNLIRQKVNSMFEVNEMYSRGKKNRVTAATNINSNSSRSHTLLLVEVEGINKITNTKTKGKLYLIDLAGSENVEKSGVDGQQLKEAGFINKSLSTFCDVINAILMKKVHVPYRNSKLTHLLQDSLGGNSKTLLITQVSPDSSHLTETLCTLQFAQRLQSMQNIAPTRPKDKVKDTEVNNMDDPSTSCYNSVNSERPRSQVLPRTPRMVPFSSLTTTSCGAVNRFKPKHRQ